jgi:hypothetical protein
MLIGMYEDRALVRTPRPEWVRTLALMTPPSERVSSLVIRWHGGSMRRGNKLQRERWFAIERWIVYQRVPMHAVPDMMKAPPPEGGNRVYTRPRHPNLILPLMDRVQRELYLETGCYHQPYWIIQGKDGGHRRNYDRTEEQLAQILRLPQGPPDLGSLCYAEPDRRTWAKLYELDTLRRYKYLLAFDRRPARQLEQDERDARIEMRLKILRSMDERAYENVTGNMQEWRLALQMSGAQLDARLSDNSAEIEAAERDFVLNDN